MDDLISRQAALDAIWEIFCNRQLDSDRWVLADVREKIESIPTAQTERKKGKWVLDNLNDGNGLVYHCTCCNWLTRHDKYAFCPNCGSDMRSESVRWAELGESLVAGLEAGLRGKENG